MDVNMATMDVIMATIFMTGVFIGCTGAGVGLFNSIYPTRYGKNHVELKGIVVGEKDIKVGRNRRIVQVSVVQFTWEKKIYEIADETNYLFKICEIGDEVIVCFNPTINENVAIIKRGKFASETFGVWLYWLITAIGCFVCMILAILVLLKVIG